MDPRKAARIDDASMNDAFREGFEEGRAQAQGKVVPSYVVNFFYKRTQLNQRVYDDIALALAEARAHLETGVDTWVEILVTDKAIGDEVAALDEKSMPELQSGEDRISD